LARFLALDWDHKQLHLVAASVGGGAVNVQRAAVWQEEEAPSPEQAEALGKLLRLRLTEAGIAAAPVYICVGRERVILKEIRHPSVSAAEEAAIIRFQAVKELTDAAEDVVIDYLPYGEVASTGERRAIAIVVRRDLVTAYQTLCKAAGLKLAALTPRAFGLAACLRRVAGTSVTTPALPDGAVGVLVVTDRWAEFCVFKGDTILFTRSLAVGTTLPGEVRRNLAVYAGQTPQYPLQTVYLAGGSERAELQTRLHDMLGVPVHPFDPFAGSDKDTLPRSQRGGFAGAVGLLHAQAAAGAMPINFVKPREPKPPSDPNRRRVVLGLGVAASLLAAALALGYSQVSALSNEEERLGLVRGSLDRELAATEEDSRRAKAIDDWSARSICWLDEYYDFVDRFPENDRIRVVQIDAQPLTQTGKDKHVARMFLKLISGDEFTPVQALLRDLASDHSYRVDPATQRRNTGVDRALGFGWEFSTKVDMEKRAPAEYKRMLPDEKAPEPPRRGSRSGRPAPAGAIDVEGGAQ
jgi:Tfp pilus assembly PilM family ATPase